MASVSVPARTQAWENTLSRSSLSDSMAVPVTKFVSMSSKPAPATIKTGFVGTTVAKYFSCMAKPPPSTTEAVTSVEFTSQHENDQQLPLRVQSTVTISTSTASARIAPPIQYVVWPASCHQFQKAKIVSGTITGMIPSIEGVEPFRTGVHSTVVGDESANFHPILDEREDLANGPTRARFLDDPELVRSIDRSISELGVKIDVYALAIAIRDRVDRILESYDDEPDSNTSLREMALARGLLRWTTDNIAHDDQPRASEDVEEILVSRRKASSLGYANLLTCLAGHVGLRLQTVRGYFRTPEIAGCDHRTSKPNMAYNIFWTSNGEAYLINGYLAAGRLVNSNRVFKREFAEHYFCCPAKQYIAEVVPIKPEHQLLSPPLTHDEFARLPCIAPAGFEAGLRLTSDAACSNSTMTLGEACSEVRMTLCMRKGWRLMVGGVRSCLGTGGESILKQRIHVINDLFTNERVLIVRPPERFIGEFSIILCAICKGQKHGRSFMEYRFRMRNECRRPLMPFPRDLFTEHAAGETSPDVYHISKQGLVRFTHVVPSWHGEVIRVTVEPMNKVNVHCLRFVNVEADGSLRFEDDVDLGYLSNGDAIRMWAYKMSEAKGDEVCYASAYLIGEYVICN